jgi:EAL domain-containing protein (putative c-di-GMP-specific phosphodiesterase class I)
VVKPGQLCFEISEASFSHNLANASQLIGRLHAIGCRVALDNFGSGLANFSTIKEVPLDFIKVDGQLVRNVGSDDIDLTMVTAINAMAHLLKIRSIAENIDSLNVLERVKSIGIDCAQGYHLGDLQPLDKLSGGVREHGFEYQLN